MARRRSVSRPRGGGLGGRSDGPLALRTAAAERCYSRPVVPPGNRRLSSLEGGRRPPFFALQPTNELISPLQTQIEQDLSRREPDVEVLLAEVVGAGTLRVFIDHPDGVTLELCERVSAALSQWRERYALEVSSPGRERPLTKPAHFRRFVGRRARVRVRGDRPAAASAGADGARRQGRRGTGRAHPERARSITGELLDASEREVTLAVPEGVIAIPYAEIRRSNLVAS
jgi:ribosome maturation factor RimP